jgi:hypothetical protein
MAGMCRIHEGPGTAVVFPAVKSDDQAHADACLLRAEIVWAFTAKYKQPLVRQCTLGVAVVLHMCMVSSCRAAAPEAPLEPLGALAVPVADQAGRAHDNGALQQDTRSRHSRNENSSTQARQQAAQEPAVQRGAHHMPASVIRYTTESVCAPHHCQAADCGAALLQVKHQVNNNNHATCGAAHPSVSLFVSS